MVLNIACWTGVSGWVVSDCLASLSGERGEKGVEALDNGPVEKSRAAR